jgi:hypothetical protein
MHNIRIMRNMLINHPSHAFCNQPALGGPVYWIRNIAYNLPGGSTRLTSGSAGVIFYNNTILSETTGNPQNNHWRNNLMLGQNSNPLIFSVTTNTNYTSSDYNGFRPNPGAAMSFRWDSPPANIAMDPLGPGTRPQLQNRQFATLQEYSQATGQDRNSILVDYDIFVKVPRLDASDLSSLQKLYKAEEFDFRLKPTAAAVDRGVALPTVTNGFAGRAPDLGALEVGQAPPHYGPRP